MMQLNLKPKLYFLRILKVLRFRMLHTAVGTTDASIDIHSPQLPDNEHKYSERDSNSPKNPKLVGNNGA